MHLDIRVSDPDPAEQDLLALGAIRVSLNAKRASGSSPTRSATHSVSSSAPIPSDPASESAAVHAHSARQHRPESSQLAGFEGSGTSE